MTTTALEVLDDRAPDALYWKRSTEGHDFGVNFPQRTIELIVMPYECGAQVPWGAERREVTEVIERGAFDGVEKRPGRVKANRDHKESRIFGKALAFYPSRQEGLIAKVQVARTALGDETLELADGGYLDVSAGFTVKDSGNLHWQDRNHYRVKKAWLRHIALVSEGAYGEDAAILSVRQHVPAPAAVGERPPMPNRASFELQTYLDQEAQINARYGGH